MLVWFGFGLPGLVMYCWFEFAGWCLGVLRVMFDDLRLAWFILLAVLVVLVGLAFLICMLTCLASLVIAYFRLLCLLVLLVSFKVF